MSKENEIVHQYPHFSASIKERFAQFSDKPLFTTDVENLFDVFIINLPEEDRQHYTCNCCRNFINRFGGLVSISEKDIKGETISVMWDETVAPSFFKKAVAAMNLAVAKARVTGVFISSEKALGQSWSGGWDHMSVSLPTEKVHTNRLKTAGQLMAEKKEDFRILIAGLTEYPPSVVDKAVTLLESESLYRSDRILGVAKFIQDLHNKRSNAIQGSKAKNILLRDNLTWFAVATAPAGFCHIKSSMIGTLLDDIVDGYSVDTIKRRFDDKMGNYQRATTAPTAGNIQQAEKIVEKLGIADSLKRRYAKIEEIPQFVWKSKEVKASQKVAPSGVFSGIAPKQKASTPTNEGMNLPSTVMTFDKFQRTVLPTAENIEVKVDSNRLMALVTASDKDAPNILQWDNTFSWYYNGGGIDGDVKRRVEEAGGKYEGNEIRCSLIWEGYTDLDLHCITPMGQHIHYGNKRGKCGGYLDIDMNGGTHRNSSPVENIRWSKGQSRNGRYVFYVHNFAERGKGLTPFKVELEINGKIYSYTGVAGGTGFKTTVFTFDYNKGQHPIITGVEYTSEDTWNVSANNFVKVNGIINSPNQWGKVEANHTNHVFFLLDGCKDKSEGKTAGFLVETLKPDLREIRKTLEAYTMNTPIEDVENASACGVGYSKDSEWNLVVKVTTNNSTRLIKIDRWD